MQKNYSRLYYGDNMKFDFDGEAQYIIADHIYENLSFHGWIEKYWAMLSENGIFCIIKSLSYFSRIIHSVL